MPNTTLFNMPIKVARRQMLPSKAYDCDKDSPISTIKGETLEPCIRGAQRIRKNPETKSIVKEILTKSKQK